MAIHTRVEGEWAVQAKRSAPQGKPHVLVTGDMGPFFVAFEQQQIEQSTALLPDR